MRADKRKDSVAKIKKPSCVRKLEHAHALTNACEAKREKKVEKKHARDTLEKLRRIHGGKGNGLASKGDDFVGLTHVEKQGAPTTTQGLFWKLLAVFCTVATTVVGQIGARRKGSWQDSTLIRDSRGKLIHSDRMQMNAKQIQTDGCNELVVDQFGGMSAQTERTNGIQEEQQHAERTQLCTRKGGAVISGYAAWTQEGKV